MNKARQLREMTVEQLQHEMSQARKDLLEQSVRSSAASDETGSSRVFLRRHIARLLTIIGEKQ
ncbi:50S ribosomal protein L29 [bacterium]|nr:50S ribosomal protein L29 [bacterium]